MAYVVVKQSPQYHQMSLEEFLFGEDTPNTLVNLNQSNTRTYITNNTGSLISSKRVDELIDVLARFNVQNEDLRNRPRHQLYREFYEPKKTGGLRKIDAPNPELDGALRNLNAIFEEKFGALYHTSAFAYVKKRCNVDCLKKHQSNASNWYAKFDLHNFFGSATKEFVIRMFSQIFPFNEVIQTGGGFEEFSRAIDLCFLDGGLPQGTPISPLITNVMMIPIDHKLYNALRDFNGQKFIYTRYADDFIISSRYSFNFREIEDYMKSVLEEFHAPFELNSEKTRYGSKAGSNWNLGLMVNADNEITVGYRNKKKFQAMLSSYIMDKKNGIAWNKGDIQAMEGYRNYYRMVERDNIDGIIRHINKKFDVDVVKMIHDDLVA